MRYRFKRRIIAGAAAFAVATPALAQLASATIRGTVSSTDSVTANASIVATNLANGFAVRTTSNDQGGYVLQALQPGTYRVVVNAPGMSQTSQLITVRIGQNVSLNMTVQIQPEIFLGTVVIVGQRDNRNSEVGTNVSQKQIDSLPQLNRNFLNFADLAPGAFVSYVGEGQVQLRGGAQTSSAVNVYIDGVGQKDYVLPGGITGQDTTIGNPFPQSAIAEYKVITQNYSAEFDQVSSVAVAAVTKSGTNEFHGEVFADHSGDGWRSATPAEEAAGSKTTSLDNQYGVSMGGPIVKDKAHWFLAYERKTIDSPVTITPGQGFTAAQLPAPYRSLLGSVDLPFREDLLFGKIDFSPNEANLFELTLKLRHEDAHTNILDQNTEDWGTTRKTDDTRVDLRWQRSADAWVNDSHLTYENASFNPRPLTTGTGTVLTTADQNQVVLNTGAGRDYQDKTQSGYGLQNDFTYTGLEWSGSHIIKLGGKLKLVTLDAAEQSPYSPQYYVDLTQGAGDPYRVDFGTPLAGAGSGSVTSRNQQLGLYIQDDWELNKNLSLNLGLRWDYERTPSYLNYQTPANVVAALRSTTGINAPGSGVNINDYISTGSNRKAQTNEWQPRLGMSFDLNADQQHVLFGGYARAYDRNLFDYLQLEQTKASFGSYTYYFDTPGHPCTVGVNNCVPASYYDPANLTAPANVGTGREIDLIDNNIKTPYSDQFSFGMRNRLGDWNTEVTLAHVASHDGFVFLLGNRLPDGSFFASPAIWGPPYGSTVNGFGNLYLGTNGLETRSNALMLKADKTYTREAGWGASFAYTFTSARENREFNQHYATDYPTIADYGWKPAAGVSRHRFVMTGVTDIPYDIVLSARLTLASHAPEYGTNCLADNGSNTQCTIDQIQPGGNRFILGPPIWGYRQVDVAMSKEFKVPGGTLRLRGDLINLFNTMNYDGYNTGFGTNGVPNPTLGTPTGSLAGPTRTFKLGLAYAW